jgi:hypothetical protein
LVACIAIFKFEHSSLPEPPLLLRAIRRPLPYGYSCRCKPAESPGSPRRPDGGCDCAYQSTASSPYVMDDNRNCPGSWRIRPPVAGMSQMQDGLRQRLGRRANLPALQGQLRLA